MTETKSKVAVVKNKRKKVAILGFTATRKKAPYGNPEFEVWGLNDLYRFRAADDIQRWDRWFEIHTPECIEQMGDAKLAANAGRVALPSANEHYQTLASWGLELPVYMVSKVAEVPNSVAYPLEAILDEFSPCFMKRDRAKYFTNSISYMVALAIYEGFEEIHIYGVDMATNGVDTEYAKQRPSCEFWLGVAVGRGIKIEIPDESDLLKTRFMYGFEDDKKHAFETKVNGILTDVTARKNQATDQKGQWEKQELQYMGAIQGIKEIMMAWQ
jgi:hypothetical protein